MPLNEYCQVRFAPSIAHSLELWHAACRSAGDAGQREFVRRNMDRECDRNDINESAWNLFLVQLANCILNEDDIRHRAHELWIERGSHQGQADQDWTDAERDLMDRLFQDPLQPLYDTIGALRKCFFLPGRRLAYTGNLYRYVLQRDFAKYLLPKKAVRVEISKKARTYDKNEPPNDDIVADQIRKREITASDLEGSDFGQSLRPIWCTDNTFAGEDDANEVRDGLGLRHFEDSQYMIEIEYPASMLRDGLCAPTFLDASAAGANNWVFVKNRHSGAGPGWGYTARMTRNGPWQEGAPEAVHASLTINPAMTQSLKLRVLGPLTGPAPALYYRETLDNPNL